MAKDEQLIERPALTLPPEEAEWVCSHYQAANVILEYGSGGSTVLASELSGKKVFSVESDKMWYRMMKRYLRQACCQVRGASAPRQYRQDRQVGTAAE